MEYKAPKPTDSQIAANAIRAMFFDQQYNGVVPVEDIEHIRKSKRWDKAYGTKAVNDALDEMIAEEGFYIDLDESGKNYLWGGHMHEDLFPL